MRNLVNGIVFSIIVRSTNQNAQFRNVLLKIDFNDKKNYYNFEITGKEISLQIEKVDIVKSEEMIIENGKKSTLLHGYFRGKKFEMFIS